MVTFSGVQGPAMEIKSLSCVDHLLWDTALGEDRWAFAIYPLPLIYLKTLMREYIEIHEVLRSYNFQPNVPVDVAQGGPDVCVYMYI